MGYKYGRDGPSECGTMRWAVMVIVTMMMVKTVMIVRMDGGDDFLDGCDDDDGDGDDSDGGDGDGDNDDNDDDDDDEDKDGVRETTH
jgi:hypothetical protein